MIHEFHVMTYSFFDFSQNHLKKNPILNSQAIHRQTVGQSVFFTDSQIWCADPWFESQKQQRRAILWMVTHCLAYSISDPLTGADIANGLQNHPLCLMASGRHQQSTEDNAQDRCYLPSREVVPTCLVQLSLSPTLIPIVQFTPSPYDISLYRLARGPFSLLTPNQ